MDMASGIALLSMYNDDDEEGDGQQKQQQDVDDDDSSRTLIATPNCIITESIPLKSPTLKTLRRNPTPQPWPAADGQKGRGGALAIVDYAATSPEAAAEEGEMVSSGYVVVGMEIDTCQGVHITAI